MLGSLGRAVGNITARNDAHASSPSWKAAGWGGKSRPATFGRACNTTSRWALGRVGEVMVIEMTVATMHLGELADRSQLSSSAGGVDFFTCHGAHRRGHSGPHEASS